MLICTSAVVRRPRYCGLVKWLPLYDLRTS
jgi:hypothetical protein